jgi:hypothetical protein
LASGLVEVRVRSVMQELLRTNSGCTVQQDHDAWDSAPMPPPRAAAGSSAPTATAARILYLQPFAPPLSKFPQQGGGRWPA